MTMRRAEWAKTPYAKSTAGNPDGAIQSLLNKYAVTETQVTVGTGEHGRPAVMLRFVLKGKRYRLMLESLDAEAEHAELLLQIKRALFYYLKSMLEVATVFFTPEEALFAFLEIPSGQTMKEAAEPFMDRLSGPEFGKLLLPPPRA